MFERMKHNQIDLNELEDSDDDFEDEEDAFLNSKRAMHEMDFEMRSTLRLMEQFDHQKQQKEIRKKRNSVQRTLKRICSVRYLDQHLFYRKSYVLHIYLTGIRPIL